MNKNISVSLLITTYNSPKFLDLVFRSILKQTVQPDEIVIGDDGSKEDTKELIDSYREKFSCKLKHVWQEDDGFQRCRILNKAIAAVSSDYILQLDGDVMLHPQFIEDHLSVVQEKQFVCGNRCFVLKSKTEKLVAGPSDIGLNLFNIKKRKRFFRIPALSPLYRNKRNNTSRKGNVGCHMAYWKKDMVAINGYNEDFVGWGYEDIEMVERLMNSGVKKTTLLMMALQYHLWHPKSSRAFSAKNKSMYYDCKNNKLAHCPKGIDQYL
ncbi:glycosyltransferase family 2 protein [Marinifilum caeruleilacunae]|uniref:Glycosyltransferase n=1 Tax=Marinifilum caeruleilacunae TaxID=2499076 RepID=A0ABX1WXN7_9BACT|nr:glycosyltransferase family 2 protein [Marinifilum caeruleilacunae]NOU60649.1 glycosyltransferase [Marinifilum caeruleilacunae]